jgi:hypothetical protein
VQIDIESLAPLVLGVLARAKPGTIVTVHPNGAVETIAPGKERPGFERRERVLATFVANSRPPTEHAVRSRLKQGLRKSAGGV